MPFPAQILTFIEMNAAARVITRAGDKGPFAQKTVDCYVRAIREAVIYLIEPNSASVLIVDACLNAQIDLLMASVARFPPQPATPNPSQAKASSRRGWSSKRREQAPSLGLENKSLEEKLEEARRPLRKILQEDCVRLGLLLPPRANELANQLSGKLRQQAEAELVVELRNNLHFQVMNYIRKNHGGPWDSIDLQEDLRLDIANTQSVQTLIALTRRLLEERRDWEERLKEGRTQNLLGGRLNLSRKK